MQCVPSGSSAKAVALHRCMDMPAATNSADACSALRRCNPSVDARLNQLLRRLSIFAMVEEIPRQGRLEGCHRISAATHLICGSEGV